MPHRRFSTALAVALSLVLAAVLAATARGRAADDIYTVHQLVTDTTDSSLVNGWGLSAGPTTPWWTSNNGTNTSTLYSGTGTKAPLTVAVAGGPTGTVFNGNTADFVVSQNGKSGAARFLFATEAGTILGWSPTVNGTTAIPGATVAGAVFKGLAVVNDQLYATDFHNGKVDVFDKSFTQIPTNGFADPKVAKGYAPFGIQALAGNIFVTYAKQDAAAKDDVAVPGQAYVDEYTPDGTLLGRVINSNKKNAPLDAPWGLAMAPSDFSVFGGDLLVGNFGNGRISAYAPKGPNWVYKGQLKVATGEPIEVDGLWAIAFGNGAASGPTNTLYFLSGPNDESHGLFGSITAG
ncbi:MAG TPA: TIGR03118 family protein [Gaiellaceae bacterium]